MRKIYNNRTSMYHILGVSLFALLFTASCIDKAVKPDSSDTKDKAEYNFRVDGKNYFGRDIGSNWDPSLGIVSLSTDKTILPTGNFIFLIDSMATLEGTKIAYLSSVTVSTVQKLRGTGAEIDAKLYSLPDGEVAVINNVKIGENYISGELGRIVQIYFNNFIMLQNNRTGEEATILGDFTAIVSGSGAGS